MGNIKRALKAFIRFNASDEVVASSLILRKTMPKVGKWQEIPAYGKFFTASTNCCVESIEFDCLAYAVSVARGDTSTFSYTACGGIETGPVELTGPTSVIICAEPNTVTAEGPISIVPLGECEVVFG